MPPTTMQTFHTSNVHAGLPVRRLHAAEPTCLAVTL